MTTPAPWTVVSHTADDSVPAVTVAHLMAWLDRDPRVDLHTVLWSRGHNSPQRYDFGRLANVAEAHDVFPAGLLRRVGLSRVAGVLAGRAVRRTLRSVPAEGVLYLSSAFAAPVLRYLPAGERTVVTHLHGIDREAVPPLSQERVDQIRAVTDVWLAVDEKTRAWAAKAWEIDPDAIVVVPEPVDLSGANRAGRSPDPTRLRLGIRGAAWFRTDHTARLVQRLQRVRPALSIELVWAEVIGSPDHLAPLLHDLERLGVSANLQLPRTSDEVVEAMDDIDVLVMTTPDDDSPWSVHEALSRGVPVVGFSTHGLASTIDGAFGMVVPYLDVVGLADAVIALHEQDDSAASPDVVRRREELRSRDVDVVGPRLLALVEDLR